MHNFFNFYRKIFGHHDFLGLGSISTSEELDLTEASRSKQHETSFIIISDLHLDNFKILNAFKSVLNTYEGMEDFEKPSLFVLMGNFRSRPFLFDGGAIREYTGWFLLILFLFLSLRFS